MPRIRRIVALLKRPRVGFIGGIDAHTFDPELFLGVASRLPDTEFVMIGATSLPEDWCKLPNVRFLGRKPYDMIARYMAAMDVLIMPWNKSEWIKACNPIKLKEYLAVGRPVVTTDFSALDPWRDLVRVADGAESFAPAIRAALETPYAPKRHERESPARAGTSRRSSWRTHPRSRACLRPSAKAPIMVLGDRELWRREGWQPG